MRRPGSELESPFTIHLETLDDTEHLLASGTALGTGINLGTLSSSDVSPKFQSCFLICEMDVTLSALLMNKVVLKLKSGSRHESTWKVL